MQLDWTLDLCFAKDFACVTGHAAGPGSRDGSEDPGGGRRMTALTCRELSELLADQVAGDLGADAQARFEAHVDACAGCRAYQRSYVATIRLARAALPAGELPEGLVRATRATTRRGPRRHPNLQTCKI